MELVLQDASTEETGEVLAAGMGYTQPGLPMIQVIRTGVTMVVAGTSHNLAITRTGTLDGLFWMFLRRAKTANCWCFSVFVCFLINMCYICFSFFGLTNLLPKAFKRICFRTCFGFSSANPRYGFGLGNK